MHISHNSFHQHLLCARLWHAPGYQVPVLWSASLRQGDNRNAETRGWIVGWGEVIEDPEEGNGAQARAREKGLDPG